MVFFKYRYVYQNTQSKLPLCAFAMIKSTSLLVPVSWNKKWCIAKKYFLDYNDIIIPWRLHRTFKNVSRVIFHANEPIFHLCHLYFSQTGKIHALIWSVTSGQRRSSPLTLRRGPRGCFRSECCTWSKPVLTTVTLSDCKETRSRQAGSKRASAHIGGGEIRACN